MAPARTAPMRFGAGGNVIGGGVLTGPLAPPLLSPPPGGPGGARQREVAVLQQRSRVDRDLRDFRFWSGMDEEKMRALTGRMLTYLADGMSGMEQLAGADAQTLRAATAERERRLEADLTQMLGQDGVRQLREYHATEAARMQLATLNQRLSSSDALTPAQIQPLAVAMTQVEKAVWAGQSSPRGADRRDPAVQIAMMDDRLERVRRAADQEYAAAAQYLTARQLEALRGLQQLKLDEARNMYVQERLLMELVP